jgi:pyridoxamine 5'-phosphate oxidase
MQKWKNIADIRRQYGQLQLREDAIEANPFAQFTSWFEEVLEAEHSDPTAMVLSTTDENGHPDSRVVLLKGITDNAFVFYTNYQSAKATQIQNHPFVALNFYWPQMARQVRIRGKVKRVGETESDAYFASRPLESQFSAMASPQSQVIESREALEARLNAIIQKTGQTPVVRPDNWGGFAVMPDEVEFWQGRDNRLHDRIVYLLEGEVWVIKRLAP